MILASELQPGPQTDALIAERLMGAQWGTAEGIKEGHEWLRFPGDPRTSWGAPEILASRDAAGTVTVHHACPRYSTDIAAAWLVVTAMARRGWKVDVQNRAWPTWGCHVHFPAPDYRNVFEVADGAPLAICRAADQAVVS